MTQQLSLVKGERIDLTKGNAGLSIVHVGCGWDVKQGPGPDYDLDESVMLLNDQKKPIANGVIYFNHKSAHGVEHGGDNLTGAGEGDDEVIKIDLSKLPAECKEAVIFVNIYDAATRRQHFGMVNNAFVRVYDPKTQLELARYDLTEDFSGKDGVIMSRLYRHNGEWKFQALGIPTKGDINMIVESYPGIAIS